LAGLASGLPAAAQSDQDQTTPTGWWWLTNATSDQVNERVNPGFRITDLEVVQASPLRFNAAFVENSGAYNKGWWWYYNADVQFLDNALSSNNPRLIDLERYEINGQEYFAAVMISNTGAENHPLLDDAECLTCYETVQVDERCQDRGTHLRFRAMVWEYMEFTSDRTMERNAERRRKACEAIERRQDRAKREGKECYLPPYYDPTRPGSPCETEEEREGEEYCRGLKLCEKYAKLAMIHDRLGVTSQPINPFEGDGEAAVEGSPRYAMWYLADCEQIDRYSDDDHPRVVRFCREVAKHLNVDAPDIPARPPGDGQGGVDLNVTNKTEIIMGDKYENVQGSTVVSRSEVKGSVYRTRDDHSTKGATGGVWKWLTTVAWRGIKNRLGW